MSREVVYNAAPTIARFHASEAFIRGVGGPIGSGKSVGMCMEAARLAFLQKPMPDGVRRTRGAIIRNTYPELKSTTIKTWLDWYKPQWYGRIVYDAPIYQRLSLGKCQDGYDVELEVVFLALDRPDDVKKLLSLEVSWVWMNEAKELPKSILDAATGRVGRYPAKKDVECTNACVFMDTNMPDDDHWWYNLAEGPDDPERAREQEEQLDRLQAELLAIGAIKPGQPLMEFFRQPSGRSQEAENMENLRAGYYLFSQIGKDENWIKVYIDAEYGTVMDGKPVYPQFKDSLHVADGELWPIAKLPVVLAFDFGGTPAAVFMQQTSIGQVRILEEVITEHSDIAELSEMVLPKLNTKYAKCPIYITGDPAGRNRSETDSTAAFDILDEVFESVENVVEIEPCETNVPVKRQGAVKKHLKRLVGRGEAGLLVSKECRMIRKGFNGGYRFKRVLVSGEAKYREEPDKNKYSHGHDAVQYGALRIEQGLNVATNKRRITHSSGPANSKAGY